MVELDGDDIRISSRGKVAERDIVQVTNLTNDEFGDPLPAHPVGWWWGVPWGAQISPIIPGLHWVALVWRDDKVDWDMVGPWDMSGMQWVWDAPGWGDALGFGSALAHGRSTSLGKEGALGLGTHLRMRVHWDIGPY